MQFVRMAKFHASVSCSVMTLGGGKLWGSRPALGVAAASGAASDFHGAETIADEGRRVRATIPPFSRRPGLIP